MKTQTLLFLLLGLMLRQAVQATVPIPDLVLYGKVYRPDGTQITSDLTVPNPNFPDITVKRNSPSSPDVIASAGELYPLSDPNLGELYVLRIRREDGTAQTMENTAISGDRLHIFVDGVEVFETSTTTLLVAGTPTEIVSLILNDPNLGTAYGDWIGSFGLTGLDSDPTADPDGDGVINYLERAYGLIPNLNDGESTNRVPEGEIVEEDGKRYLTLTYTRSQSTPDIIDVVELSFNMTDWDDSGLSLELVGSPQDLGDGYERVTVRYATPISETPNPLAFLQVRFRDTAPIQ